MNIFLVLGILPCILSRIGAEYSIAAELVPKTLTYQQAISHCKLEGKELCNSQSVCQDGKTPYSGVLSGDHWVPVSDSPNEWIQIGNSPHRTCILHSSLGVKPVWGLRDSDYNFKGNLFCCKLMKDTSIAVKVVSNTISYQQAQTNCHNDDKELCTSKEICNKDGKTPNSGPLSGDHWVPVKDSSNEWLQIGISTHKPCTLHSNLGSKPTWGESTRRYAFKGFLFCCV